jgi:hypothetical protein
MSARFRRFALMFSLSVSIPIVILVVAALLSRTSTPSLSTPSSAPGYAVAPVVSSGYSDASQTPTTYATATPTALAPNFTAQESQFCASPAYGGSFSAQPGPDGVTATCTIPVKYADDSTGSITVLFNSTGSVFPDQCLDYAWTTQYHVNVTPNEPDCGAPPEPVATAMADCQAIQGEYFSPILYENFPPPSEWFGPLDYCAFSGTQLVGS